MRPENGRLLAGVCAAQAALLALPALWGIEYIWVAGLQVLALGFALFSVQRTLLVLLLVDLAVPAALLESLELPGGLRLQEGLLLAAALFALVDLVFRRGVALRRGAGDRPVLVFLAAALLAAGAGLLHHHPTTVILRDLRFPLYYVVFFLVTHFVGRREAIRYFAPALLAAGLIVSLEYILEFVGAIDLQAGNRFVRVARLQGIVLPVAILLLVNQFIYAPRRWRAALLGLFLPLGLAFVLTVGRGMWLGCGAGLFVTVLLWHFGQERERRRAWRALLLVAALLGVLVAAVFVFQRFTGAAVGAHALERSRSFVDYQRDVHVVGRLYSYGVALEAILRHPFLGNGQGAVIRVLNYDEKLRRFEFRQTWTLDSLYLSLWWKMGLFGLFAFVWLCWRMLRLAHFAFGRAQGAARALAGGGVAVLASMGVLGLSDGAMVNGRMALLFGIFFGLITVLARTTREEEGH